MADYYPLLAKAVAGLSNSTPETRRAIYERARAALIGQLRRMDPPVPESDLDREAEALEAAVARLEAELTPAASEPAVAPLPRDPAAIAGGAGAAPPTDAPARPSSAETPRPRAPAAREEGQKTASFKVRREPRHSQAARHSPAEGAKTGGQSKPGAGIPPLPAAPFSPRAPIARNGAAALNPSPQPGTAPSPGKSLDARGGAAQDAVAQGSAFGEPRARALGVEESGFRDAGRQEPGFQERIGDEPGVGAQSASDAEIPQAPIRARSDAQRPFAPQPPRDAGAPKRLWIVGAIVGLFVLLIAVAAFELRDRPEDLAGLKPTTPSAPTDSGANGKIVDRIGGGAASEGAASSGARQLAPPIARIGAIPPRIRPTPPSRSRAAPPFSSRPPASNPRSRSFLARSSGGSTMSATDPESR